MDIFIVLFGMLGRFFAKLMRCHPIDTVVTAATAHLVPRILRKGWSHYTFLHILSGQRAKHTCSQWSMAKYSVENQSRAYLQCSLSSVQAVKETVKI